MDTNQLIEKLMAFNLTRQEATIYLALHEAGAKTGYEIAKQTGISRSNAYNALAGLVDKGAAYTEEGTATRYVAVHASEFCENKIRALHKPEEYLISHMTKEREEAEGYLTILGDRHIADKIRMMLEKAEHRVYFEVETAVLQEFLPELEKACDAGIKVVIMTDKPTKLSLKATVYENEVKKNQIGVITDSTHVLTGEYGKKDESSCLYTGQRNFVRIFKDSMKNEIKLIELTKGDNKK